MLTTRHMTAEAELLHWLVLILVAMALILVLATALAADPMQPNGVLAPKGGWDSHSQRLERPFFPENPPLSQDVANEMAGRLWMTLEHQQAGCAAEALAGWSGLQLPSETAVWREVAMAAAYFHMDDFPQALRRLEEAETMAPHHPLIAYVRGLVWMQQAEMVTQGRPEAMVERAIFELMAIADLNEAIAGEGLVESDLSLLEPTARRRQDAVGPRVGDVMVAVGADNFVSDAHARLFRIHVRREEFLESEYHLDQGFEMKAAVEADHLKLAQALLVAGQRTDALRVMRKSVDRYHPWMGQFCNKAADWAVTRRVATWVW